MKTLGMTQSVCHTCRRLVPAKIAADGDGVHFVKFCPDHGQTRSFVFGDVDAYVRSQRFVKPAWTPREFSGDPARPCPDGCGFCDRHEQHLCMPIVEITQRCDLACPVCLVDAGRGRDMTLDEFNHILDALIRAEKQVDVLNLSGGEPLLHPRLIELIDAALARAEIIRISLSTNGLQLLEQESLIAELRDRDVCVSLQLDGFDDGVYHLLRGRPMAAEKQKILDRLADQDAPTSLTVTLAGGINEDQLPAILECLFTRSHVLSTTIQPVAFAGRGRGLAGQVRRLTMPDVLKLLDAAGDPRVSAADFVPLPCGHPHCFTLAYYLMLDGDRTVSINRLIDASGMMDTLANRTIFGLDVEEHERIKDMIYDLWSGPAGSAPDGEAVLRTLRGLLDAFTSCCFDPRRAFTIVERRIKSIFIHAFQDAETFDLARVRRCCNAYPQPDGSLIPACVHNVIRRGQHGSAPT